MLESVPVLFQSNQEAKGPISVISNLFQDTDRFRLDNVFTDRSERVGIFKLPVYDPSTPSYTKITHIS